METPSSVTSEKTAPETESPLLDFVREVCDRFGPRPPGTAAEAKAAGFIAERLKQFCDEVSIEEERCSPRAVEGSTTIFLSAYLFCLVAYWYVPSLAAVVLASMLLILYLMRYRGYEVFDRLFHRATTENVVARVKPSGTSEKIVIFSGHHDSARYSPIFKRRFRRFLAPLYYALLAFHLVLVVAISTRLVGQVYMWLNPVSWILYCICIFGGIIFALFRLILFGQTPVMGANDNLAGVSVAVAAAEHFAKSRPQRTEIWAVSFGAEECGLRGSKRFARRHHVELSNACLINIEMVGDGRMIAVEGEKSGGTKHSPEVVSLILDAAERCGVPMSSMAAPFGETDAASFSRRSLKASTIAAIDDENFPPNWHVLEDTAGNMDETHLQDALKVCIECVHMLDHAV